MAIIAVKCTGEHHATRVGSSAWFGLLGVCSLVGARTWPYDRDAKKGAGKKKGSWRWRERGRPSGNDFRGCIDYLNPVPQEPEKGTQEWEGGALEKLANNGQYGPLSPQPVLNADKAEPLI